MGPEIKASKFDIFYYSFEGPEDHIPARSEVTQVIESAKSPYTFSHCKVYAAWETDEIIGYELWRNVGLAMICVFVVTLLLFWNITIDIISCVNIVLAIGLCVDYSVHVGHAFLIANGTRQEKAVEAVSTIGPAVFNGGFTTFLALFLCGFSTSHVFITFFKVFSLTVVFGLFHGLLFFPVVLSLLGPEDSDLVPSDSNLSLGFTDSSRTSPTSSGSSSPREVHDNLSFHNEDKPHVLEQP